MDVFAHPASGRHVNAVAPVEAPARYPAALAGVEMAAETGARVQWRGSGPPPEGALRAVHDAHYLAAVEAFCVAGGGYLGPDTGTNEDSWGAALHGSGGACAAVESALSGTLAFSVARPPGHHAGRATPMGFCILNHAAVAAEHALASGAARVAILDWDVHHGNGTQDVFYERSDVLYLSVHQSPFYPGTGAPDETGVGPGEGFTANVALARGSDGRDFAGAFAAVFLPILREYRPDVLIVSAGYDAHAADPLGGLRLTADDFGSLAATLAALSRELDAAPPAFVLEGGYDLGAITEGVAATITGAGRAEPGPPEGPPEGRNVGRNVGRAIQQSVRALAPYWEGVGR